MKPAFGDSPSGPPIAQRIAGRRLRDVAIVLCATLSTAAAALLIEDLFPLDGDRVRDPQRWTVWVLVTVMLLLLLWSRQRQSRRAGTLYYVRYLMESMPDWRLDQLDVVKRHHLDLRVVTKWCSAKARGGILDISTEVAAVSRDLQQTMNDDQVETGYNVAPNLLVPAGIAIGYDLYRWDDMTLEELFEGAKPVSLSFALEQAPDEADYLVPGRRLVDGVPGARAVLVSVDLTPAGKATRPDWRFSKRYRVAVWPHAGTDIDEDAAAVTVSTGPSGVFEPYLDPDKPDAVAPWTAVVHPWAATLEVVATLREALHDNPEHYVVLIARLPKTVAVSVGWWLTNCARREHPGCGHARCTNEGCLHPWRRLVIALWDQERAGSEFLITRVHPAQPSPRELRRAILEARP